MHNNCLKQFHRTSDRENPSSSYRDIVLQVWQPSAWLTAHPPGPWRQYPSSPEGWGVKIGHSSVRKQVIMQDSKIHVADLRPTWIMSASGGPHVGAMNLTIRDSMQPIPLTFKDYRQKAKPFNRINRLTIFTFLYVICILATQTFLSIRLNLLSLPTQISKLTGPTWGPSGYCRHSMGPMLAPWTLLSG